MKTYKKYHLKQWVKDTLAVGSFILLIVIGLIAMHYNAENYNKKNPETSLTEIKHLDQEN